MTTPVKELLPPRLAQGPVNLHDEVPEKRCRQLARP